MTEAKVDYGEDFYTYDVSFFCLLICIWLIDKILYSTCFKPEWRNLLDCSFLVWPILITQILTSQWFIVALSTSKLLVQEATPFLRVPLEALMSTALSWWSKFLNFDLKMKQCVAIKTPMALAKSGLVKYFTWSDWKLRLTRI